MSTGNFNPNSIDAKLATIIGSQIEAEKQRTGHHTELMEKLVDHEKRLTSLEGSRNYILGVVGTVITVLGCAEWFHLKNK